MQKKNSLIIEVLLNCLLNGLRADNFCLRSDVQIRHYYHWHDPNENELVEHCNLHSMVKDLL